MKKAPPEQNQRSRKMQSSPYQAWFKRNRGNSLPVALGLREYLVICSAAKLSGTAYGASIRREIKKSTGLLYSTAAISGAIDNLEEKGFLAVQMSGPTGGRGGRSRRMVPVTNAGLAPQKAFTIG
jgi:PadR family transcriptional regulator, regulatory protein PadR